MGVQTVTIQNLEIVKVDAERNLLLVSGSIPGPKKGLVFVQHGVKAEDVDALNPADFIIQEVAEEVTEVVETAEVNETEAQEAQE
jgi:large subunit ribosomal protein L3